MEQSAGRITRPRQVRCAGLSCKRAPSARSWARSPESGERMWRRRPTGRAYSDPRCRGNRPIFQLSQSRSDDQCRGVSEPAMPPPPGNCLACVATSSGQCSTPVPGTARLSLHSCSPGKNGFASTWIVWPATRFGLRKRPIWGPARLRCCNTSHDTSNTNLIV